jgi:AAA15 family ATPase/GTPase
VGKTKLLEALLIDKDKTKSIISLADILLHVRKFTQINDHFLNTFFSDHVESFPQKIFFRQIDFGNNYNEIKNEKLSNTDFFTISGRNKSIPEVKSDDKISNETNVEKQECNFNVRYIPFGSLYSHELARLYSNNIQLYADKKASLIESLSHIIKNLVNIEVNASYSHNPILLISEKSKNKLSPLAAYGDGTVKLFRILLSLFSNDHYSRLMIEELDAGVHYSRLTGFIISLLKIAKEQGKQIFATSHSKECIESFTKALEETGFQEEGRIIRLAETKHGIKAYSMEFAEFENSLLAESEIR